MNEQESTIPLCYGDNVVEGLKILQEETNPSAGEKYITCVFVLAEGPIHSFNEIRLNDVILFNNKSIKSGVVGKSELSDKFKEHIQVEVWNGEVEGKRSTLAELNSNGNWKNTSTLKGRAAVIVKARITSKSEVKDGDFTLEARIQGRPLIDIRYNSPDEVYDYEGTNYDAGTNPALVLLDYLTHDRYGAGFTKADLDLASFAEAANWCDINNYCFHGFLSQQEEFKNVIPSILDSFRGSLTRINGFVYLVVDQPQMSDQHFDLSNTVGKIKIEYNAIKKYFNQVEVAYTPLGFEQTTETLLYPPTNDDPIILKDNKVIKEDLKLPFTKTKSEVDVLASMFVRDNQAQTEVEFETLEDGFNVQVNDVFTLTLDEQQWDRKPFRAYEVSADIFGSNPNTVKIKAREFSAHLYDEAWDGVLVDRVTPVTVPAAYDLAFDFVESKYGITGRLKWNTNTVYETQVMYKLTAEPDSAFRLYQTVKANEVIITDLKNAYYDFYVVNRDIFSRSSEITYLRSVDCFDDTILPKVLGLTAQTNSPDFTFNWDDMLDVDINIPDPKSPTTMGQAKVRDVFGGYEIHITSNNNTMLSQLVQTNSFVYSFADNKKNGLSRDLDVQVYIVAKAGARSPVASIRALNQQQSQLSGVAVFGGLAGINVSFDAPTAVDHRGVEIHLSRITNFTPSSLTLVADLVETNFWTKETEDKGIFYLRLGAYDCFGRDGMLYSPSFQVSVTDVNAMLEDISSDQLSVDLLNVINGKADSALMDAGLAQAQANLEAQSASLQGNIDLTKTQIQTQVNQVDAKVDLNTANIKIANTAIAANDAAMVSRVTQMESTVKADSTTKANTAEINATNYTTAKYNEAVNLINTKDAAQATLISSLTSTVNGHTASITSTSSALSTLNGRVNATWALRLVAGNKISGIGIANDGATSTFSVLADSFKIYANGTDNAVFAVDNGKLIVKSAHIGELDAANIRAGAISASHIQANAIQASHISANTITGDKIQAGTKISSPIIEGGQVRLLGSNYMEISSATPFGPDSLVKWCGALLMSGGEPNWGVLRKSNATQYVTVNGDAYFGGSISAGILKTGVTNPQEIPYADGSYGVEIGPFGSNGKVKNIVISFSASGLSSSTTKPSANLTQSLLSWQLERSINSSAFSVVSSGTFNGTTSTDYEAEDRKYYVSSHINGSQTFTDTTSIVGSYTYRLKIVTFTRFHATSNMQYQMLSLISTEQ